MGNKFISSYSIKTHVLGFSEVLESIFLYPLGYGSISPEKNCQMLEEGVLIWKEMK